ncbi:hypothetical protein [Hyphomicrobium sp.]|uniref:hypothetical protein n=1 Tax=Hyphomicrobium sp. TaxID=82 RepID=UPI0025B81F50|nr:hypothetical protein [Hyphomicrobium sp.]MCC7252824.1 hypothetical protein [Hyphomicrobium sp.]
MTEPSDVIAWKYANALIADAEPSGAAKAFGFWLNPFMSGMKTAMGGLWVGGRVALTREAVVFTPNAVNVLAHSGETSRKADLARIVEVVDRFGWFTRIVDVRTDDDATLTFRCYGAPAFAEQIRRAVSTMS